MVVCIGGAGVVHTKCGPFVVAAPTPLSDLLSLFSPLVTASYLLELSTRKLDTGATHIRQAHALNAGAVRR